MRLAKGDKARVKNPDSTINGVLVEVIEVLNPDTGPDYKVALLEEPQRSIFSKGQWVYGNDHELVKEPA